ncbi:MAG: tRNA (adenosine(37)-N6)-threonylcarbamoyltransferase complex dimerization subunit type 1 TsaB [Treponema sp.]|nr:tRNA (adenosine(37)-N6)-threonylcarbamoyltransferase complex dimerization subunit type 1 TsaB [Treponema sp.]
MHALAIDSAPRTMTIAAKKDTDTVTIVLDVAMKQSEKILPAINWTLAQLDLTAADLDYAAICKGPGTFTGLRIGFAALKALQLSHAIPLYAVPTLDVYAYPFSSIPGAVISVIDAKKDQFFAAVYRNGTCCMPPTDTNPEAVLTQLDAEELVTVTGANAGQFADMLQSIAPTLNVRCLKAPPATDALFALAEGMIARKEPLLADYDGPAYLRKSEAEIALKQK